jgi:hypothetical protein
MNRFNDRPTLFLALLPLLFSCASSNLGRSWVAPDAGGTAFTKIGIVALTNQEVYRREAEYALQQELGEPGLSSYMVLPELNSLRDTAQVVAKLKEAGCDGIVTLQLKSGNVMPDTKAAPTTTSSYGAVADDYWVDPSAQQVEGFASGQYFSVEVHVFDLAKRKMVYNGLVIEQGARSTADLVRMVRRDVMNDLKKKGLVTSKP